ncbi:hypothetical protein [Dehalobacter sp.]|uniref:hypothetical protein n=1 Tax=Dehalobacter sp. TaxID=1962289 RepID=UPI00258D9F1F|nr:hypothetical protein [Dehalobacter sp.]MDJ0305869.1 hypothetical protein [Dehalobacter sp.]
MFSPTFGLAEIKTEVFSIGTLVEAIFTTVENLSGSTFIEAIYTAVYSPTFGLAEIKTEVFSIGTLVEGIYTAIYSPTFGLEEIKTEVFQILKQSFSQDLTTGIAQRDNPNNNDDFYVEVLNNRTATVSVTLTVFDFSSGTGISALGTPTLLTIGPGNVIEFASLNLNATVLNRYEVTLTNVTDGIYIWSAFRLASGELSPANTFRAGEFVPLLP